MIATVSPSSGTSKTLSPHAQFVAMLPQINVQATIAFRDFNPEAREDAIQEVIANCFVAFCRLLEQDKRELAYPSVLGGFAIKQFHDGRRVSGRVSARDVMSRHARAEGLRVVSLDVEDEGEDDLRSALVEDKTAGPAETAAARIDVEAWFRLIPNRKREIAKLLASGETTKEAARRFRVSAARISELRQELRRSWLTMQGDCAPFK
jgi:hypothetical protein